MILSELRKAYHTQLFAEVITLVPVGRKASRFQGESVPNFADKNSNTSCAISLNLLSEFGQDIINRSTVAGQTTGANFEGITRQFLEESFGYLQHLRPGEWLFDMRQDISAFQQYRHLAVLRDLAQANRELKAYLGEEYLIKPDIIVARSALSDDEINQQSPFIDSTDVAPYTPLRSTNSPDNTPILHASISVKWTIRSDRSQNSRTEALNLIRNRKGHTPKIAVVTAEPLPSRIASIALGTGDIDCVYHFALPELINAVTQTDSDDLVETLDTLISGDRLRDISDLPLDLAI